MGVCHLSTVICMLFKMHQQTWYHAWYLQKKPSSKGKRHLIRHRTDRAVHHTCHSHASTLLVFSAEQLQLDFVEMLRVRDEKRRKRHVETLRRQKELGEDEAEACGGGEGGARVELLGDLDEDHGGVLPSVKAPSRPQPPPKTASYSPTTTTSSSSSSSNSANITNRQVRWSHLCHLSK